MASNLPTTVVNQKDGRDTASGPNHAPPTTPPTLPPETWRLASPCYRPPSSPGTPTSDNCRKFWRVTPRRKTICCCRLPCSGPVCLCYQRQILMGEDYGGRCQEQPQTEESKVFVSDSNPSSSACPSPGEAAAFDSTIRPPLIRQNGVDESVNPLNNLTSFDVQHKEKKRASAPLAGPSPAATGGPAPNSPLRTSASRTFQLVLGCGKSRPRDWI